MNAKPHVIRFFYLCNYLNINEMLFCLKINENKFVYIIYMLYIYIEFKSKQK